MIKTSAYLVLYRDCTLIVYRRHYQHQLYELISIVNIPYTHQDDK